MPNLLPKENLSTTIPITLGKRKLFPSISRFIPESSLFQELPLFWLKISAFSVISAVLLALTCNQYVLFINNREHLAEITRQRVNLNKELNYWKEMASKYNNYPDLYLKIASLEYRLGNAALAKIQIDKALSINPDIEQGSVLGEQISRGDSM